MLSLFLYSMIHTLNHWSIHDWGLTDTLIRSLAEGSITPWFTRSLRSYWLIDTITCWKRAEDHRFIDSLTRWHKDSFTSGELIDSFTRWEITDSFTRCGLTLWLIEDSKIHSLAADLLFDLSRTQKFAHSLRTYSLTHWGLKNSLTRWGLFDSLIQSLFHGLWILTFSNDLHPEKTLSSNCHVLL
jgi:hypothetical protein